MLPTEKCIELFSKLGLWFLNIAETTGENEDARQIIINQENTNKWLIPRFTYKGFKQWGNRLSIRSLEHFLSIYPELRKPLPEKHIAVVPEENIPLAGLHELICVLLSGHHFYCRNNNHDLLKFVAHKIVELEPGFRNKIHWVDVFPKNIDSYLVSLRPDEKVQKEYFQKKHSLIREKHVSAAVISPDDGINDFRLLADDIFQFFGLSSRNVRKLFVPVGFCFTPFLKSMEDYSWVYSHNRYANNYDFHQSVFLMERIPFLDNGFLILRESDEHDVPVGCLYYEYYQSADDLSEKMDKHNFQAVAAQYKLPENSFAFGNMHHYQLWDYADHQDIIKFLTK